MTEQELLSQFCKFLVEQKKYPPSSLLTRTPAFAVGTGRVQADLLLLDVKIGDYIGLVEFKSRIDPQIKKSALRQIQQYLGIIKAPSLPSYLVYPISEVDFHILVFGESDWEPMPKDEFPQFETLATKKKREEKVAEQEVQEKIVEAVEVKREKTKRVSVLMLASLIIGVIAAIVSSLFEIGGMGHPPFPQTCDCARVDSVVNRVASLERAIVLYSNGLDSVRRLDTSASYIDLEKRIKEVEESMLASSDRALILEGVRAEITALRIQQQGQEKVLDVKQSNMADRVGQLNSLVIGLILALFTGAIGFVGIAYSKSSSGT